MFSKITIKLTSPFLGSEKPNEQGVRNISKSINNNPRFFIKRFLKLCNEYAKDLGIGEFTPNCIKITNELETNASTKIYMRCFKNKEGVITKELFESYPIGSLLTFGCYIDEKLISLEKAIKVIEYVGKYNGISQFGYKWNYGRFDIDIITKDI